MTTAIMLHVCCAPCASHCIQELQNDHYAVTLCFTNDNIAPEAEYRKRLDAARRLAEQMALPLLETPYNHGAWLETVAGLETQPEGGSRCRVCFDYNLRQVVRMAQAAGIERITTSLTVSPHKSSRTIFDVGRMLEGFEAFDFKKRDGFRKSLALSTTYGLYRQRDCGCEFSRRPV